MAMQVQAQVRVQVQVLTRLSFNLAAAIRIQDGVMDQTTFTYTYRRKL